jgi:predicted Fe-Mo cluster-binding NifX family protein
MVVITALGPSLDSPACPRFGRAPFFLFIDPESGRVTEALQNPHVSQGHGVGLAAAATVLERQPESIVSGSFGPKAHDVLRQANVALFVLEGETVGEALNRLNAGSLQRFSGDASS